MGQHGSPGYRQQTSVLDQHLAAALVSLYLQSLSTMNGQSGKEVPILSHMGMFSGLCFPCLAVLTNGLPRLLATHGT